MSAAVAMSVPAPAATTGMIASLSRKEQDPAAGERRREALSKVLSAAPGFLTGAAVMFGVKSAAAATAAWVGAPAMLALAGTAVATGLTAGAISHVRQAWNAKDSDAPREAFWSKANVKKMAFQGLASLLGGASFMALDGIVSNPLSLLGISDAQANIGDIPQATDAPAPVETAHAATPVPQPVSAVDKAMTAFASADHLSAKAERILDRAATGNAQAIKDLAYYAYNGLGGVPKNPELAVDLYKQAAEAGSLQAKRDLAWLVKHGLATLTESAPAPVEVATAATQPSLPIPTDRDPVAICTAFKTATEMGANCDFPSAVTKPGDYYLLSDGHGHTQPVLMDKESIDMDTKEFVRQTLAYKIGDMKL